MAANKGVNGCTSFNLHKYVKACCSRVVFYMQELRDSSLL